ncbi:MAG: hypothetical protein JW936_09155 [Sedimentisphaerales bacterium]|nr:hypothetical protein [Sedimentisphaerales bacterium]
MAKKIYFILLVMFCSTAAMAASVREYQEGSLDVVELSNDQVTLKIAVNNGARIFSLLRSQHGYEEVWWHGTNETGLLDDKMGLSGQAYAVTVEDSGPERVVVRFDAPAGSLAISKTVTLVEGEPAIRVLYTYRNTTTASLETSHMVRNYYLAGGEAGTEDHYFWHDGYGIESRPYPYGDVGEWHDVRQPWYAVLDMNTHTGLAWVVDSPLLGQFYNWADASPSNPSVEWVISLSLAPSEVVEVPVVLALLDGFSGVTDASQDGVINLVPSSEDRTLSIDATYMPLRGLHGDRIVGLRCDYDTLDRLFVWGEVGVHYPPAECGQVLNGTMELTLPQPGTYVVTVEAQNAGEVLNHFEIPVDVGQSSGTYYNGHRQGRQSRLLAVVSDVDVQRGYCVSWGGRQGPLQNADSLEFYMGVDEYESLEVAVLALSDLGSVSASISGNLPADAVLLQVQDATQTEGIALDDAQYGLVPGNVLQFNSGDQKSFWLTMQPGLAVGDYAFDLNLEPSDRESARVHFVLHVVDATQSEEVLPLHAYHTLAYLLEDLAGHAELMKSHYIREVMIFLPSAIWDDKVRMWYDDAHVLQADFSGFDRLLQPFVDWGFTSLSSPGWFYDDDWISDLYGDSDEQRIQVQDECGRLLFQHILDLGFQNIVLFAMDEPSVEFATCEHTVNWLRRLESIHPDLKLHTTINNYSPVVMETINCYLDWWNPSWFVVETFVEDLRRGDILVDPDDNVGFYVAAFLIDTADTLRGRGWRAASLGLNNYSVFAYHHSTAEHETWKLFANSPQGPVTTPAFEGLRDGYEEFRYYHTLGELIREAADLDDNRLSPSDREVIAETTAFYNDIFGPDNNAMIRMELRPGVSGARAWNDFVNNDRWQYLRAKGQILQHIAGLKEIMTD